MVIRILLFNNFKITLEYNLQREFFNNKIFFSNRINIRYLNKFKMIMLPLGKICRMLWFKWLEKEINKFNKLINKIQLYQDNNMIYYNSQEIILYS